MPADIHTRLANAVQEALAEHWRGRAKLSVAETDMLFQRTVRGQTIVLWFGSPGYAAVCAFCGARLAVPQMPGWDSPPGAEFKLTCSRCTPRLKAMLEGLKGIHA